MVFCEESIWKTTTCSSVSYGKKVVGNAGNEELDT